MQASIMMRMPQRLAMLVLFFLSGVSTKKLLQGFNNNDDKDGKDGAWLQSFPRARCMSRCLSLHSAATLQNNGSLAWCRSHKECAKCLNPCKDSWHTKRKRNCKDLCMELFPIDHWECVASCEFLQTVSEVKQGGCPLPTLASGFAAACVDSCDHDTECPEQKKCCSSNCGHTCQYPQNIYKGVPVKPRKKLDFEEVTPGQLEVRWSSRLNISAEPVVYILQTRWNFGIEPSDDADISWHVVAQTTEQRTQLYNIRPGRWHQFRVAAVNGHGTRGFTTPSRHICSSRDPPPPPAPTELRATNITFASSQTVWVQLQWRMLEDLDVPVDHYKVFWGWTATGQTTASSLTKWRKLVRDRQVILDGIQTSRTYRVEVQAVSYWKQTQLKGPRAIVHFSTELNTTASPKSSVADDIHVGTPFYQNGQLQVHIYWQRSTATPQKALIKPNNLRVSFKVRGGNLSAIFNWETSASSSQRQLTGYRVTLVEVTSISQLNNSNIYQSQILNPDMKYLAISDLHLASVYRLAVRAITADGEGPAISRTFQTPSFQHVSKHTKYD